jgi:hypothetical protein
MSQIQPRSVEVHWPGRRMDLPAVTLTWQDSDGLRCNGAVSLEKSLTVVPNRQYQDGITQILDAIQDLIRDAYEDYQESDQTPGQVEEEEDEEMGSG